MEDVQASTTTTPPPPPQTALDGSSKHRERAALKEQMRVRHKNDHLFWLKDT